MSCNLMKIGTTSPKSIWGFEHQNVRKREMGDSEVKATILSASAKYPNVSSYFAPNFAIVRLCFFPK